MSEHQFSKFTIARQRWQFFLAQVFGKRIAKNVYRWRGRWWVCGDVKDKP